MRCAVVGGWLFGGVFTDGNAALAQDVLEQIVITAPRSGTRISPPTQQLGLQALRDRQPKLLADIFRTIPGVSLRPNSRGEAIVRVRGSDERQTAIFFDGAPLTVPWDGRVDIAMLPAGLIGNVTVTKGAVPIEYGANAVAGAVDLQSRRGAENGGISGDAHIGILGFLTLSSVLTADMGSADLTLSGSYSARDAEPVASRSALPFSQDDTGERTNTDFRNLTLFGAVGDTFGNTAVRASLLHSSGERGIAPEAHLDPAKTTPRYWRYPDVTFTQLNLSAQHQLADTTKLRVVAWRQWFEQRIDAFRSDRYENLRSREDDADDTIGMRATLAHKAGGVALRWSGSAQRSTHTQVDTAFPVGVAGPQLRYRQNLFSTGVEADVGLAEALHATLGIGYDRAVTPLTGDKPPQSGGDALVASAAVRWDAGEHWSLTVSGGKRTRFPSAREYFGEALGRFLINPDLRQETAWLADAELAWTQGPHRLTVTPFFQRNTDTLAQRAVRVGGQSLRQRYNLKGSAVYGIDVYGAFRLRPRLLLEAGGSFLRARADAEAGLPQRKLPQRPGHELVVALDWAALGGLDLRAELRRTGTAVDLDGAGGLAQLPASTEINLRSRITVARLRNAQQIKLLAAADNVTNAVITPQLGLPLGGRVFRIGIALE